jgi:hypothetical protein
MSFVGAFLSFSTPILKLSPNSFTKCNSRLLHYRYDFKERGKVTKEDVKLLLSHVPIKHSAKANDSSEKKDGKLSYDEENL